MEPKSRSTMGLNADGDVDMFDEVDYEPDSDLEDEHKRGSKEALKGKRQKPKGGGGGEVATTTGTYSTEKVIITGIPEGIGKKVSAFNLV